MESTTATGERSPGGSASDPTLNVAGLIRRVRRLADLSQGELARLVGVDQSTIARWENGQSEPRVGMFQRLLGLAGLDLAVRDSVDRPVVPMRADAPRDRAGRHWPAHLDVRDAIEPFTGQPLERAHGRAYRDLWRGWSGCTPQDHPSHGELAALRRGRRESTRARLARAVALGAEGRPARAAPPCACDVVCFGRRGCAPACVCECEPPDVPEADVPEADVSS
ncbi:MAG: helix-turn-helix domain-containing protein [Actinomycetes bacterium]